jgi:putative ABC transport system substrate-binding protein
MLAVVSQWSVVIRGTVSLGLGALVFVFCPSAEAQHPKKVARVGYLSVADPTTDSKRSETFRQALREQGYVDGQNITIEYRYAEGKRGREADLAADLVRLKVDLIVVAGGDTVIRAAMNATKTIPIILIGLGSDPVKAGFVESLARPGGNVTGLTALNRELGGKRLELLKQVFPKLNRVAVLYDPSTPGAVREVKEDLPVAAQGLGLTVQRSEISDATDLDKMFAALNKNRPDGLYAVSAGALIRTNLKRIATLALKSRLPSVGAEEYVYAGGIISYDADWADRHRRAATYVDKILKGAKPADLPVEQPTKFEFIVNLKSAKQIGLTIPPNVLARADTLIR